MKTTLRDLTTAWPLVILLLLPALTRGETAVQAWAQRYAGPVGDDRPHGLAVDSSNHVIVTGYSCDGRNFSDYLTIKYSSAGVPLWTNRYNGPASSNDVANALAIDSRDNVIVTGETTRTISYLYSYIPAWTTIKYSSDGAPLWTNHYVGPDTNIGDQGFAIAVDRDDNLIVAGRSSVGYATVKYSSAGAPLWTNCYRYLTSNGGLLPRPGPVAVDDNNNVIVTGDSAKLVSPPFDCDWATIKYSSAGVPLWTNRLEGPGNGNDCPSALAVDHSGDVIVVGYFGRTNVPPYFGALTFAVIKYSSAGIPLWTNLYYGPGISDSSAGAVAVDGSNDVVVAGGASKAGSSRDYVTIKYSSAGMPLWTNFYSGPGINVDSASAVAVDCYNNIIVTGYSYSAADWYSADYATIKYSSAGVPLWTNRYNGPSNSVDAPSAVTVDRCGNIVVTGSSKGAGCCWNWGTIQYVCVPEPVLGGLQMTNGTFRMRVDSVLQPGTLVIEACTNLADWAPVFTNAAPTNTVFYTDPEAGSGAARFYRAFQFP